MLHRRKVLLRKSLVFIHITTSVAWLGAVIAYLCIAVAGLRTSDSVLVANSLHDMVLIGDDVLIPLSLIAFASGIVVSLTGPWGLVRHWWVTIKLLLTGLSVFALEKHMTQVFLVAKAASHGALTEKVLSHVRGEFIKHPAGGLVILFAASALSVYKPRGLTPYGKAALIRKSRPAAKLS
jgi:uncharacterized membrane protein